MPERDSRSGAEQRPIDRAVAQLGRYYGAISRDAFTSLLLDDEPEQGGVLGENVLQARDIPPVESAARALMDLTTGGLNSKQFQIVTGKHLGGEK